ncbi:threonine/serine exporter family protein [uncultured Gemmiger sp.]|uniref:threonine/serine exporter family protein n=1 Tax=uncultured Gemmiger sp. TaxID=1623490 RepID=UPI0025DA733F|nr:threonine/serine exporter family protein [uncultured Gemmiger sp.]
MEYLFQFVVAAVSTLCFGITFQVPRRHLLACGIGGGIAWLCYVLCLALGLSPAMATFAAALPLTLACRLFAIRFRAPVTLFLLCGIFPLVPGAGIYYTAYYFLQGAGQQMADKGFETAKIAIALALGIALVSSLPLPRHRRARPAGPRNAGENP